jgi:hypothetical protein
VLRRLQVPQEQRLALLLLLAQVMLRLRVQMQQVSTLRVSRLPWQMQKPALSAQHHRPYLCLTTAAPATAWLLSIL